MDRVWPDIDPAQTAERGRGGDRGVVDAQLADPAAVLGTRTKMGLFVLMCGQG